MYIHLNLYVRYLGGSNIGQSDILFWYKKSGPERDQMLIKWDHVGWSGFRPSSPSCTLSNRPIVESKRLYALSAVTDLTTHSHLFSHLQDKINDKSIRIC